MSSEIDPATKQSLEDAIRDAGAAEPAGEGISTAAVLAELGRAWPGPLSPEQESALEALCRKIHVAKKVTTHYKPRWKKDAAAPSLSPLQGRLLVVVLIAWAAAQNAGTEEGRGLALKLINAAFAALDLFKNDLDESMRKALTDGTESILEPLLEGNAA